MSKRLLLPLILFVTLRLAVSDVYPSTDSALPARMDGTPEMMNLPSGEKNISPTVIPPPVRDGVNFLGQDHYYSLVFRGNGEAVVTAKITFSNLGETPLAGLVLRVPRIDPKDLTIYQVIKSQVCIRYGSESDRLLLQDQGSPASSASKCLEYRDPDYFQPYLSGSAKYLKAKFDLKVDTLTVNLPQELKPNGSGSIFIYYRAAGYAKKNVFGTFDFTFETLKAEERIRNLQVGISTDSDLVLRGARGKVSYRFEESGSALKSLGERGAVGSPVFDSFYQQIGQGAVLKNASDLQPMESFLVKGSYADSFIRLYGKEIFLAVVGILVLAVFFLALVKFLLRLTSPAPKSQTPTEPAASASPRLLNLVLSLITGFLASVFSGGYTILLIIANKFIYGFYPYEFTSIIMVFLLIVSVGVYSVLILGPSVFLGAKRGFFWGFVTFILTVGWLAFYLFLTLTVLFLFSQRGNSYPPIRY